MLAKLNHPRVATAVAALVVFLVAVYGYAQYGFDGLLLRDDAVFAYAGQQLALGVAPYASIFQPKTPLSVFFAGLGAVTAPVLGVDSLRGIRYVFFIFGGLTVAAVFLLANRLFASVRVGLLAAFVFVGYWGFGRHAASGPRAKTLAVGFEVVSLWLIARRNWFWAGLVGALAFLTWQPMIVYPVLSVLLAFLQSPGRSERVRNSLKALSGFLIPNVIMLGYFWLHDAAHLLYSDAVVFPLRFMEREALAIGARVARLVDVVQDGFPSYGLVIIVGAVGAWAMFAWRIKMSGSFVGFVRQDAFVGFLISWLVLFVWSLLDLQGYPDFFVLLPYCALGFAWILALAVDAARVQLTLSSREVGLAYLALSMVLVLFAVYGYARTSDNKLEDQRQWAGMIESRYLSQPGAQLVTFGKPEALVLLERRNANRHIVINSGEHRFIEVTSGLSMAEWVAEQMRTAPEAVVMGPVRPLEVRNDITDWLAAHQYTEHNIGNWNVFVKQTP